MTRDLVFTFSTETWRDATAREFARPPDRLVQAAITSHAVGGLLVADPWRSGPRSFARSAQARRPAPDRGAGAPEASAPARGTLLQPHRLRRRDPSSTDGLQRSYAGYDRRLRRAAGRAGLSEPAVLTCHPFVAGFAPLDWAGPVTYFARDDWTAYPPHRRWWPAYTEAYRRIARRGLRVAAVSQVLLDRIAPTGPTLVVPNGVDAHAFRMPGRPPVEVERLSRPRYVYAGTLDERLDLAAVEALAASLTEGCVVLVGPQPTPLPDVPGVRVLPAMGQADLVATLAVCDVALLPHRVTALTEAMSPLKLYEYLAAGLPVATVNLQSPDPAPGRQVRYPDQAADLGLAAARALGLGRWGEPERLAFLDQHSWAGRTGAVLELALRRDPGGQQ